ncbi:MAG: TspO/MBR family protein [Candidatus Micrarchaeia archaeon]
MKKHSIFLAILFILLSLSAGFIGSFFTFDSISTWYQTLNKPFFSPPNWVFGPVWTTLYILIGISAYLAYESKAGSPAMRIFGLQLILNALWSILFFGLKNPTLAFIELILLWISIAYMIKLFYKYDRLSAYLLIPYILWVTFAGVLNLSIALLN